jgi:flagellin
MTSILTNSSAITALQSLRMTQQSLQTAQKEVSTGLKISSAADNASTYAIAQTIQSDQGVMSTLSDSLSQSSSMLNVAAAAVKSAIDIINSIKNSATQAQQPGADTAKIGAFLAQQSAQLKTIVSSASFNGINLLDGSKGATLSVIASYTDGGTTTGSTSAVGTIDVTLQSLIGANGGGGGFLEGAAANGTDFTNLSATSVSTANAANTLMDSDQMLAKLTDYASTLGASQSRVTTQAAFVKTLNDALTQGVSSLVDADMNEVSTRLQALQTQQQLGVQSLSIANQNAQMVMKLFQ